jgi:hypothetical protein
MSLFNMFKSFLSPEKGYQKGQDQLNKYYDQSQGYIQPYNTNGQEAYGHLNTAMQNLLNPSKLYDQFLNDYQQSAASKYAQERAMNQGNWAAQSMGLGGSTPAIQAIQQGTNEIGAQDQQNYMKQMIDQYIQGAGLAQGIYGQGAQAGNMMSQNANNMGTNSAEMAFGQQNAPGQMFGNLLGTAANLGGAYMGMKGMNNMTNAWKTKGGNGAMPAYMGGSGYSAGGY